MAQEGEKPRVTREQAERMRQRAQELLDKATPEQRQELERLARELARQSRQEGESAPGQADRNEQPDSSPEGASPQDGRGRESPNLPNAQPRPGALPGDGTGLPGGDRSGGPGDRPSRNPRGAQLAPTNAAPVDVRPRTQPDEGERVIADYFNPRQPSRSGVSGRTALEQGVREAAGGVERAIEQQAVPNQYSDLVRRVFRRYVDRVRPDGTSSPEPLEDAPDLRPRTP